MPITQTEPALILTHRRVELRQRQPMQPGLLVDAWHDNGRWRYRTPTGNGVCSPRDMYGVLAGNAGVLTCLCGVRITWAESQWRHLDTVRDPHQGEPDDDGWRAIGRLLLS